MPAAAHNFPARRSLQPLSKQTSKYALRSELRSSLWFGETGPEKEQKGCSTWILDGDRESSFLQSEV